jgi:Family of unknown function (DUF6152)
VKQHGLVFALMAGCVLAANTGYAHHSHASLDPKDVRVLSGVVTKYSWSMPHVYLKVQAPNLTGKVVEYSIEMLHPGGMAALGWDKNTFKAGDRITWEGEHDRNKDRAYSSLEWAEREGVRVGLNEDDQQQVLVPSTDFTGLWNRGPDQPTYFPPKGWPLTAKGQALVEGFSEDQNPVLECYEPGPPKSMTLPYAHRLSYLDAKTLLIERDLMDDRRVVHLDRDAPMGPPSKMGHSIGWFENGDLIVETRGFTADRWGTHTGIDSSTEKQVREHFRLTDGGRGIEIEITVTDPVYLASPATFKHRWIKVADRDIITAPCTMESAKLWIEAGYNQ